MDVLDTRNGRSVQELHDDLMRLLLGSKEAPRLSAAV